MKKNEKRARKRARISETAEYPIITTKEKKAKKRKRNLSKKKRISSVEDSRHSTKQVVRRKRKKRKIGRKKKIKKTFFQLGASLVLTAGVVYLISLFTFTIHRTEGYMMNPAAADGDVVFVNKRQAIRRFDLVLIKDEEEDTLSIRRVIGLPLERVFYKNDELFINDVYQVERFLEKKQYDSHQMGMILTKDFTLSQVIGEEVIPKEEYFVLGDNRIYARDSRDYGTVKKSQIVGVVKMRLFPFHKMSGL